MNLFAASTLILSLSGILFSLIVFHSDIKNKINRLWFFSCIAFSLWSFSLYVTVSTSSLGVAWFWQYVLDVSGIFLPALYLLFLFEFFKYPSRRIRWATLAVAGILSLVSFSPLFKVGMAQSFGEFYWVEPGPLYISFPIYFILCAGLSFFLLVKAYRGSEKGTILHAQVRNMILGGIMGYAGGVTNFFPQFFKVYPFGNYLVIFYIVFMVYGVIRYKLLSAKVISAQLFSTALGLVALFNFIHSDTLENWVINFGIFILVLIFSLLLIGSVNREVFAREKAEELTIELRSANDRLRELDVQKTEFISFATHQLRAPLTAIKGYASLIVEGELGAIVAPVKDAISRVYESAKTMANVVDDYLNVSRIELGSMKYNLEPLDMKALVTEVAGELKPNIEKAGLKFTFNAVGEGPWTVAADPDKLKQVIANIIDNSVKYTPSGGLSVALERVSNADGTIPVRFTVTDTGIGIAPAVMPKLFAKFSRADNANKQNIHGTGLGLFIAKEIIGAHKGKIWAESEGEGKGSKFIVELPAA